MNSEPQRWKLPPHHKELLKTAMSDGAGGTTVSAQQRSILRQICSEAERATFEPEDFLIAFKRGLVEAANEAGIPAGPERNDLLSRLVSVGIQEFYRAPPLPGDGARIAGDQELTAGGP